VVAVDPVVEEAGSEEDEVVPAVVVGVVVVGSAVVVVGGRVVVVVGGRVVVLVVARRDAAVETGGRGRRWPTLVEEAAAVRLRGWRVVDGATAAGGAREGLASPLLAGAASTPSRVPPTAPSATATTIVAHRRSRLNRTNAPRVRLTAR
jgi:hypothetical protein